MSGTPSLPEPRRATERALVELTRIPPDAALQHVFERACELSAEALQLERVGIWLFTDEGQVLRCASLYERAPQRHSAGAVLQVADFPNYFASLGMRKSLPAESAATEPWTAELVAEYLAPLGITSMLDAGIFVDGQLVGVVCHEHIGPPRTWSTQDRDFAGSVADRVAIRIQSAEVSQLRAAFKTQQKRVASQARLAAMEELAAGIAHDFKNLLTACRIYSKLLAQRTDLSDDAREQAREIFVATERGAELARELMEFARPMFAPPAVLDLGDATCEAMPVLQAAVGPRCQLHYGGSSSLARVLMEKSQFRRLLLNIVVNASEAMPDGGEIRIRVAPVRRVGNPRRSGRFVMLEVVDHGVGMDQNTRRRLFEPYFTTKPKGTGLGMPIVNQIINRVGGFLRVSSQPGRGTRIRMFFPAIRTCAAPAPSAANPPTASEG